MIPFEILAAGGVVVLLEMIDWLSKRTGVGAEHGRVIRMFKVLVVVLILIDSGNCALRSAALLPFAP